MAYRVASCDSQPTFRESHSEILVQHGCAKDVVDQGCLPGYAAEPLARVDELRTSTRIGSQMYQPILHIELILM